MKRKYRKVGRLFKWGGFNFYFVERALQEHMLGEFSCKMLLEPHPLREGTADQDVTKIWEFQPVMG